MSGTFLTLKIADINKEAFPKDKEGNRCKVDITSFNDTTLKELEGKVESIVLTLLKNDDNKNFSLSIKLNKSSNITRSTLNIPIYMFKIVCFNHIQYPDITFIDIFIFKNKLYKIDKTKNNINFIKFLLPIKSYNWFETISNINITNLLHFYNIKTDTIKSFKNVINLNINIKNNLRLYIDTSYNMATLTEATTLDDLYNNYNILKNTDNINIDSLWIQAAFYKRRNKLIRDKILYTNLKTLNKFNIFFDLFKLELTNKYTINDKIEFEILGVDQDTYLNLYYNYIKEQLKE